MTRTLRYGILGTGNIAGQFAEGVAKAERSAVTAVGSRSAESAAAFGKRFGLPPGSCHGSYEALIHSDAIDAVYVSLPNHLHAEWSIRALAAGKHVLCEKPLAMDAAEAGRMFDAAQAHGRVLMEAFMYRCHPLTGAALAAVRRGDVGEVRVVRASFCYRTNNIDDNVRFDPAIGGGALMDIGSYCLSFARMIAGNEPTEMHVVGHTHATGVDDYATAVLRFPPLPGVAFRGSPMVAALSFGMTVQLDNTAWVGGTDGYLSVPVPWKPPEVGAKYVLHGQTPPKQDKSPANGSPGPQTFMFDAGVPLYGLEADAFAASVRDDAPLPVTPADTRGNMAAIDTLARQLGADG
ncbi:MAG: Gfo/Idh/MocA family oxidoreductase [Planctomycetota bacterium]